MVTRAPEKAIHIRPALPEILHRVRVSTPGRPGQGRAVRRAEQDHDYTTPGVERIPRRRRRARDHGTSGRDVCRDRSGIADTTSSQPLSEKIKELASGTLIELEHAAAAHMRVEHDLTVDLCHPEVAETLTAVDLAGDRDSAVLSAHDGPDC